MAGLAIATISSEGKPLDPRIGVISLEVHKQIDRIPEAQLILIDGSVADREYAVSNAATFEPGKSIRVELRYEGETDVKVFEGLVVRHAVEAASTGLRLRIELNDAAIKMTRQRKTAVFRDQLDSDVISKLIKDNKLEVGKVDATKATHVELVQHYASDWDFMLSRADVNGQVVLVSDGTVSVRSMSEAAEAKVEIQFGLDDVFEFELEVDGGGQWAKLTSQAWDAAQKDLAAPVEAESIDIEAGNLEASAIAAKLGGDSYALLSPAALAPGELGPWASARLARSRLALVRGRLLVAGRTDVAPFDRIELGGVGERFNGKLLVSGVTHRFDEDGWNTELRLGLSPEWFARIPDIADVPAAGLLPAVHGLLLGIVEAFEDDPSGEQRIRVRLPALTSDPTVVWARVARPDAGKDRGFVFWPEIGDEVVVGFFAGDPRQAIVLGSLHGSVTTLPAAVEGPSDANNKRALVSKAGTVVLFDDEKPSLAITTAKKNTIVIDDDTESITLEDQHGNKITMDSKGITLQSAADFKIDASGKVVIKGSAVDIQ